MSTPAGRPQVTFVVPHQRRTTGGVYVIEQHARQLAAQLDLTLAVCAGELTPIPGVNVRSLAALDADSLPPAEVLVYPADLKQAEALLRLPADRGRAVMLFQGYGTPGSPVVLANLTAAREVVGVAHWLVDEARRTGVNCSYVPHGLDRELFAPGSPAARRPGRITMMTHRLDWKGLADGLAAIARVRAARPEVEVVVFGVEPVAGVDEFVASPTRTQVAGLLQTSTVHVVASWEEGFGLTGAEALACGAALATTDTKGSRDYALHGRTALVSPPRDPAALAAHVLELLGDPELRSRQVAAGQRHLEGVLPSWPEASRRLARALRVDSGGQRV